MSSGFYGEYHLYNPVYHQVYGFFMEILWNTVHRKEYIKYHKDYIGDLVWTQELEVIII